MNARIIGGVNDGVKHVRRTAPRLQVADAVCRLLSNAGVRVVFGIPGGTISPFNDALLDHPEISVFVTRHESEAVFAACGHAMVGGGVGVVFVTSGPGVTNTLTGIAAAKCDGVPLLILAGEVPRSLQGKGALQDGSTHHLNVLGVASHLTKACFEITEPQTAPTRIAEAIRVARSGRAGPVLVTLPLDVLMAEIFLPQTFLAQQAESVIDPVALDQSYVSITRARRPVLFVGSGVRAGEGPQRLLAFAEHYALAVMTTPKAKGVFPEDHPQSLGVFGIGGHPSATRYLEGGVTTLLAVGTSFGDLATDGWSRLLSPDGDLIHVDVDPHVIGRNYAADLAIVAPAASFFAEMTKRPVGSREVPVCGVTTHSDPETTVDGVERRIAPSRAVWELQHALPDDALFIIDSGEHFLWATHHLRLHRPDAFIAMTGLGAMGSSLGLAIGAKLAAPDRPVVVIIGDGGFTMVGMELLDAVAAGLPIVVVVINDRRLGMCEIGHANVYGRSPSFAMPPLDIVELASSVGARGLRARHTGDLLAFGDQMRHAKGPVLIDVEIDRSFKLPKKDRIGALGKRARSGAASGIAAAGPNDGAPQSCRVDALPVVPFGRPS